MKNTLLDLLADLVAALAILDVHWYVFGAQAVAIHGRPRLTQDVDVTVDLRDESRKHLIETLSAGGFVLRTGADDDFIAKTRVLPLRHTASGGQLDLVLAGTNLEREFAARAKPFVLAGVSVPVITPEDLLVTKLLSTRGKDIEDARTIVAACRKSLDRDRVIATLRLLEQAIDSSDLVRQFKALEAKAAK
jgi:hypothetical protein